MYTVEAAKLHSKSKNSPYDGEHLYGRVVTTIKQGPYHLPQRAVKGVERK